MPKIAGISVRRDNRDYRLSIAWDDDAFVEGNIKFDLEVGVQDVEGRHYDIRGSASASIEQSAGGESCLVVRIGEKECFNAPLHAIFGETTVVDQIPGQLFGFGDPVIGCLLRAGIAATCGQIIECKDRTAGYEWIWDRLKAIGKCLRDNSGKLAGRALLRAGWCLLKG